VTYSRAATFARMVEHTEVTVGDKSPKSKQRDQQQKHASKATDAAAAKAKQAAHSRTPPPGSKGKA
jgi:hypothetical protein